MENKYYPHLFQKGTVGGVVLKNRIVRNSMGTYLGNPDGTVTDRRDQRPMPRRQMAVPDLSLWITQSRFQWYPAAYGQTRTNSSQVLPFLLSTVKEHGAVPGIQLAHPGRDAAFVGSADVIGASEITAEPWYEMGYKMPRALTIEEIHDLVERFGDAAVRCKEAGFEINRNPRCCRMYSDQFPVSPRQ